MKSYSAEEIAKMPDVLWLINSGCTPKIDGSLMVDTVDHYGVVAPEPCIKIQAGDVPWPAIHKYRLHNGPGYKDGIAIDYRVDDQAGCKITELKEQNAASGWVDGLPPIGEVCEVAFLNTWLECKVMCRDGPAIVYSVPGVGYDSSADSDKFRPIKSKRDKVIDTSITSKKAHH